MTSLRCRSLALVVTVALAGCGSTAASSPRTNPVTQRPHGSIPAGWSVLNLASALHASTDQAAQQISGLGCTSGPFCMILAGNEAISYDAGSLGSVQSLEPAADVDGGSLGPEIACSSPQFCLLATQGSTFFIWNGNSWTSHEGLPGGGEIANGPAYLTCPSDGHCLAIGQDGSQGSGTVLVYDNPTWTQQPINDDQQVLDGLVCASSNYCLLHGNDGDIWTWSGSSWTGPTHVAVSDEQGGDDVIGSPSCAAGPTCLGAAELAGVALLDRGEGFAPLPGHPEIEGVSPGACGSGTFCVVQTLGPNGPTGYHYFDGTSFVSMSQPPPGTTFEPFFSCTPDRFCMDSETNGNAGTDVVVLYQEG